MDYYSKMLALPSSTQMSYARHMLEALPVPWYTFEPRPEMLVQREGTLEVNKGAVSVDATRSVALLYLPNCTASRGGSAPTITTAIFSRTPIRSTWWCPVTNETHPGPTVTRGAPHAFDPPSALVEDGVLIMTAG